MVEVGSAGVTLRLRYTLLLVAAGLRNPEIAAELGISVETVKQRVTYLMSANGVRNRTQLAALVGRRREV